jgi:Lrp/AsnC family transcriptional regulator, regulator for asnA, asnC and gidA
MTDKQVPPLDELDLRLIAELERDGRQSVSELAGRLRMSWSTIADRLERLQQEKIIRFLTLIDPLAIGHTKQVLVAINAPPSRIDSVARRLADIREVYHVSIHTGRYDIFASVSLPEAVDLWGFVSSSLAPIKDITRAETMVSLKVAKFSLSLLANRSIAAGSSGPLQRSLDDLDYRLLRQLRASPRSAYTSLAASAGCSKATARRRIERLIDDQVLQVIAVADPIRLGYSIRANIGLGVRPGMIDQAASALAASPDTHHVVITTGSFDLLFTTFLKTQEDLSRFVREYLGTVPGVVSHEVMVLMKVTKDNLGADWGFGAPSPTVPPA